MPEPFLELPRRRVRSRLGCHVLNGRSAGLVEMMQEGPDPRHRAGAAPMRVPAHPGTDAVMLPEALRRSGINIRDWDAWPMRPDREAAAAAPTVADPFRSVAFFSATGEKVIQMTQADLKLSGMSSVAAILHELDQPRRARRERPFVGSERLPPLPFRAGALAVAATECARRGAIDGPDGNPAEVQPDRELPRTAPETAGMFRARARCARVCGEFAEDVRRQAGARFRTRKARSWMVHACSPVS
ncbi:MAG: hypothetical protein OXI87_22260 [Albidovulum sp.]|nr:hypothetical protein [Albidovulum sp.]MDE0533046.1 hypothetical protein [Albidovulum sp.]